MGKAKKTNNPGFVRVEDCQERRGRDQGWRDRMELAIFGKDGRGGMVRDVGDIKANLRSVTGIVRTVVIPIVVPIIVAVIISVVVSTR
jgi:hypothetical protein